MADVLRSPGHVEHLLRRAGVPRALAHLHAPYASHAMRVFGIGSHGDYEHRVREVLYFLAQGLHETGGLRWLAEFWGPTAAQRSYAYRMGNHGMGDAYHYRGGGVFQLTGKDNYRTYGAALHQPLLTHPDLARQPRVAWLIAALYWTRTGCGPEARAGHFETVTRKINGGLNGLGSRRAWLHRLS